jgi:predicted transcriptional regulator
LRTRRTVPTRVDDLEKLSPNRLAKYNDSLEVLKKMRTEGGSLAKNAKLVKISPNTVKRYVGSAFEKRGNRIVAKHNDDLLRKMRIYKNGKEAWIQVRGKENASKIGRYHSAVGRRVHLDELNALDSFKGETVTDFQGKKHSLENDYKKIQEIFKRREEPEYFTIYTS